MSDSETAAVASEEILPRLGCGMSRTQDAQLCGKLLRGERKENGPKGFEASGGTRETEMAREVGRENQRKGKRE
jgi:hypothetical protein